MNTFLPTHISLDLSFRYFLNRYLIIEQAKYRNIKNNNGLGVISQLENLYSKTNESALKCLNLRHYHFYLEDVLERWKVFVRFPSRKSRFLSEINWILSRLTEKYVSTANISENRYRYSLWERSEHTTKTKKHHNFIQFEAKTHVNTCGCTYFPLFLFQQNQDSFFSSLVFGKIP